MSEPNSIQIKNAKVHNLKNISVNIPKNKLTVLTGVSGSGKSSLAFDTLYAEGQRRYVESLSSYARQFLGLMEKPDVELITGLSPAISIDQKTSGSNPRSTVGTITEIYDYLRLLYAKTGSTFCPKCGKKVQSQTIEEILQQIQLILATYLNKSSTSIKLKILSPVVQNKKGNHTSQMEKYLSEGFLRVNIDEKQYNLDELENIKLDKNIKHNIDLIIDRLKIKKENVNTKLNPNNEDYISPETNKRLRDAIELALSTSDGEVKVQFITEDAEKSVFFSENNTCKSCNISYPKITPTIFSFNSPQGACSKCAGLGYVKEIDPTTIFNPRLSIKEGGIFPWSNRTTSDSWTLKKLLTVAENHNFSLSVPIGEYNKNTFDLLFYGKGAKKRYKVHYTKKDGTDNVYHTNYEGVIPELERHYIDTDSDHVRREIGKYMIEKECSKCSGKRLKPFALAIKIDDKNIDDVVSMPIEDARDFILSLENKLNGNRAEIARPIIKEVGTRLSFLQNVGLNYLTLSRYANTLSGGESQRIRLASQIGTGLTGVLYVLDEPSIGLHSKDIDRLLTSLKNLRDVGNTVVVVEHDWETIQEADWIIDIGPLAGNKGGEVVAEGTVSDFINHDFTNSVTSEYIKGKKQVGDALEKIKDKKDQRKISKKQKELHINNVSTHNLKNIDIKFPLGNFICITGVSGSGKSSLINDTLYPALINNFRNSNQSRMKEGVYGTIEGLKQIDKVISIDQSPIGRTPRSNPATYSGVFTPIRSLFAETQEAKARGYKPGRFSFNVKGGRCEKCRGEGQIKIEMQFLPDMYITCEQCEGTRYNKDALQIDYKEKNISDVLDMTVEEAHEFFKNIPSIERKLKVLDQVGLGYIKLGQSAVTLSGGESQRVKLAKELSKMSRGHTIYILDEPTTGLHFYDIDKLLFVLKKLVNKGNTVVTIEHNLDLIKFADWIIDLGPEGGEKGGEIVTEGTVEDIMNNKNSYTGEFLKKHLSQQKGIADTVTKTA